MYFWDITLVDTVFHVKGQDPYDPANSVACRTQFPVPHPLAVGEDLSNHFTINIMISLYYKKNQQLQKSIFNAAPIRISLSPNSGDIRLSIENWLRYDRRKSLEGNDMK